MIQPFPSHPDCAERGECALSGPYAASEKGFLRNCANGPIQIHFPTVVVSPSGVHFAAQSECPICADDAHVREGGSAQVGGDQEMRTGDRRSSRSSLPYR